jgi:glycerol uptake facilitator-like aquaporin
VGSTLAAGLVWQYPGSDANNIGNTDVANGFLYMSDDGTKPGAKSLLAVMLLEFCITYALLYSLDFGDENNSRPGRSKAIFFSIGPPVVLFLGVRTVGEFTGASFNLARSFGPALVSWKWGSFGYYTLAHLLAVGVALWVEHNRFKKHIQKDRLKKETAKFAPNALFYSVQPFSQK